MKNEGKGASAVAPSDRVDAGRRNAMRLGIAGAIGASSLALASRPGVAEAPETSAFSLTGKTALVTGAARGIGRTIAVAFAAAGTNIAALDIADPDAYSDVLGYRLGSQAELEETVALIEAQGRRAIGIEAEIADGGAIRDAVRRTLDRLGQLDELVANAGVGGGGPLQDVTDAHFKTVLDINLTGTANTIRAALTHMTERNVGRIIVVASIAGRMGSGGNSDYAASKWDLVGLVKSAAIELGPHNITVNAIAPTAVQTGIFGDLLEDPDFIAGFETALRYGHTLPVGMLAQRTWRPPPAFMPLRQLSISAAQFWTSLRATTPTTRDDRGDEVA